MTNPTAADLTTDEMLADLEVYLCKRFRVQVTEKGDSAIMRGVAAIVAGALLVGCPTVIRDPVIAPPPAPADAGATACHNGAPWRFTAGAWSQADRQCNRLSTDASAVVCCATPSALRSDASVHACVPMARCSPQ